MQVKIKVKYLYTLPRIAQVKKNVASSLGKDVEDLDSYMLLGGE